MRATFCATRDGVPPQTLELRAWADDYLPGRPHSESAAFVIHVLNKTDHALWLTEQFGRWLHSARDSYERDDGLQQRTGAVYAELAAAGWGGRWLVVDADVDPGRLAADLTFE